MSQPSWTLPTERIRMSSGRTTDAVIVGPLAVNFSWEAQAWVVTHIATGAFIGKPWPTCQAALAALGGLLTLPGIDWTSPHPTNGYNQAIIVGALDRVRGAL